MDITVSDEAMRVIEELCKTYAPGHAPTESSIINYQVLILRSSQREDSELQYLGAWRMLPALLNYFMVPTLMLYDCAVPCSGIVYFATVLFGFQFDAWVDVPACQHEGKTLAGHVECATRWLSTTLTATCLLPTVATRPGSEAP
eukprot:6199027-Pleurochrysis_carterae.AAC.5